MRDGNVLRWIAGMLGAASLGAIFWLFPALSDALFIVAAFCGVGAIVNYVQHRRTDRYSLNDLQRVQERAELDAIDVPDVDDLDMVHCLGCGESYNNRFKVCPRCRRPQTGCC